MARGAAVLVLLLAGVVLLGWSLGIRGLTGLGPAGAIMKANAAVALLLGGAGLWLAVSHRRPSRRLAGALGAAVCLIGALTLLEHLAPVDFHIDLLLFAQRAHAWLPVHPNRFGMPASICFVLGGLGLLLLNYRTRRGRSPAHVLFLAMVLISLLSLLGYLYGIAPLYNIQRLTAIAPNTALAILLWGVGLLLARPDRGLAELLRRGDIGGITARRLLLPAVAVVVLLGWVRVVAQDARLIDTGLGTAGLVLLVAIVFVALVWWNADALSALAAERAAAQAQWMRGEARFRAAQNLSRDAFAIFNPVCDAAGAVIDFQCDYLNPAAERLFASAAPQQLLRTLLQAFPARWESTNLFEICKRVHETAHPFEEELQQTVAGAQAWFRSVIIKLGDDVALYFTDVTEAKTAERTLRERQERLDLAQRVGRIGTFEWHLPDSALIWSPEMEDLYGLPPGGFGGTFNSWRQHLHPDDVEEVEIDVSAALHSGEMASNFRIIRPDGTVRWMHCRARVMFDEQGRPGRMIGINQDVTDRRSAEMALSLSQERLKLTIDASELGTFYCDLPLDKMLWNDKCKEQFFLPPDAEIDFPLFYSRLHPDDRAPTQAAIEHAMRTHAEYDKEYRILAPEGQQRWLRAIGRFFYDSSGNPTRFDGITMDISERKRQEQERERLLASERMARGEAERASRMKDEFLATLSHELRTPLNAILGWSQLLGTGTMDPGEAQEAAATIERNARVQAQLIEDLLDMSRITSGKIRLDMQRLDLAAIADAAIGSVHPAAEARQIRLHRAIERTGVMVRGDSARLQQVMWNLLSNAIKFTPVHGQVSLRLRCVDAQAEFTVSDSGQGIDPGFLPHVFDRFRQADASTTRHHGGMGLGLSIVKSLAELHGGSVEAASPGPGRGATFTVLLPLAPLPPNLPPRPDAPDTSPHAAASPHGPPSAPSPGPRPRPLAACDLSGVRILIVDDEPDSRALLRRLLEDCHASVLTAASAGEAIEILHRERPQVLLSDIGMPEQDGYDLIRAVRSWGPGQGGDVPAAAVTAFARDEDRRQAFQAGFQSHIAKPVDPSHLIAAVAHLAGRPAEG
jgi:PAS domain S-box-containing protein